MVSPTIPGALGYQAIDLDEFAAALADLASAITHRDAADAWCRVGEIRAHDNDLSAALAGLLYFAGLTCEVTS